MRIDRLYLTDFKNLRDFEADFDVTSSRQVIVGRNGVGKSNLLEAICLIFRDLDLEDPASFAYTIDYYCNRHYVRVKSSPEKGPDGETLRFVRTYAIAEDKTATQQPIESDQPRAYEPIKQPEFYRRNRNIKKESGGYELNPERLLPSYVFGYYSGTSGRFTEAFDKHEEQYYKAQIRGEEVPLRPLFLAKPHHSQLALLSFFVDSQSKKTVEEHTKTRAFLRDEFGIIGFESALFAFHKPYWSKSKRAEKDGDSRFWGVGGKVVSFLKELYTHSLAPMTGMRRHKLSVGTETRQDMRYFFIPDEQALQQLAAGLGTEQDAKEFFARMESAIFSDILSADGKDLRARVFVEGAASSITFKELSEGEQQLLTLIGLMRFTQQDESLFLLDEPDTHLNPAWCLNYLSNLEKYMARPESKHISNSQIIMTTHSPLTFAGLSENEVLIIQREKNGSITSHHPISAPRGMGFQAILTSEFFGLRSALDKETLELVDEKRELTFKEEITEKDQLRIIELDIKLGKLDFSKALRDPLYLEFVRAMTKAQQEEPGITNATPTMEEWKLRQEVARDIVRALRTADKQ